MPGTTRGMPTVYPVETQFPMAVPAGFAVSLLYTVLSLFPIIDVPSWKIFTAKILIVLIGANLLGFGIYLVGARAPKPRIAQ